MVRNWWFRRSSFHVLAERVSQDVAQLQRQLVRVKSSCKKELDANRQIVPPLDTGERVFHQKHGSGTITDVSKRSTCEHEVSVRFDSGYAHHYNTYPHHYNTYPTITTQV